MMNDTKTKFQEKEELNKIEYIAGIVDSEGTIDYNNRTIRIQISNTDKRLIKWLKKNFGGSITSQKKKKEEHRQAWVWRVHGKNAYMILFKIKDKLLLKNEQCLLCVEQYERITKPDFRGRNKPLWAKKLTEEIINKLHILNERGIDKTGTLRDDSEIKIENNLAYMAGYIDGDGTIGIQKKREVRPPKYQHRISVSSTDIRSLEWVKRNYGGEIAAREAKKEGRAKIYVWHVSGENCYILIKDVRNYLLLKQEQADAVIEIYERVTKKDFRTRPMWAVIAQEELFQKCKKLNKVGVPEEGEEEIEEENKSQTRLNIWTMKNRSVV